MEEHEEQDELKAARSDYSNCILANAWMCTVLGLIPAVSYGAYYRSYTPLVLVSVVGSGVDYMRAKELCKDLAEKIKNLESRQQKSDTGEPSL